jgi:hypothetical protein
VVVPEKKLFLDLIGYVPLAKLFPRRQPMKRLLVLAGMLLCLTAPMTALAQGVHLGWNGCGTSAEMDNAFACTSNTTLHQLVSSFNSPPGITNFIGATSEILVSGTGPLGAWWQLQAGGCRTGALSSEDPSALVLGDCSTGTFDGSANLGLANYEPNFGGDPTRGRITTDMARSDLGVALTAGTEYQANVIQIRSTKTTGTGACAGCNSPVGLLALRVFVAQPTAAVELAGQGACASFRGGQCGTPNRKQSWGEVKSLYR